MNAPNKMATGAWLASAALTLTLTGCGSSSEPGTPLAASQASAPNAPPGAMIYVSSGLQPAQIERCLSSRLSRARVERQGRTATMLVGPRSVASDWRITLEQNAAAGTTIAVYPPSSGSGEPDETSLRYHLARCAV